MHDLEISVACLKVSNTLMSKAMNIWVQEN